MHATQIVEDLGRATQNMIVGAIAVTTGRLNLERPDEAAARVSEGDPAALEYFRHELAHQIAMLLMRSDEHVISVFMEHDLPEAEELGAPALTLAEPIELVVYSDRETAALRTLIDAVDHSLIAALSERWGPIDPGLISAKIVSPGKRPRTHTRANGFRPPPTLLVSREE